MRYRQCYTHPGSYDSYLGLNKLYETRHMSLSFFRVKPSIVTLARNIIVALSNYRRYQIIKQTYNNT